MINKEACMFISKKLFLLVLFPLYAFSASNYKGIYIGGAIGGSILDGTSIINTETQITFSDISTSHIALNIDSDNYIKAPSHNHAAFGSFNIGYGFNYEWFFNGFEFFFSRSLYTLNYTNNISATQDNKIASTSFVTVNKNIANNYTIDPTQVGLDLRPGYIFKKKGLLYARIGAARASVSQTASLTSTSQIRVLAATPTSSSFALPLISAKTSAIYGLRLGGGLEYLVFPQCSVRLDYVFTTFNNPGPNTSKSLSGTITNPESATAGSISSLFSSSLKSITDNVITLGINYYFSTDSWLS